MDDIYSKSTDQILVVDRTFPLPGYGRGDYDRVMTYIFDFEFKTLAIVSNSEYQDSRSEKITVHPFPTVDAGLLQRMHDKLTALGGHPAPLTPDADAKPLLPAPTAFQSQPKGNNAP